jgi:hypothetical protein
MAERLTGFAGDTLASALLANGVGIVGRSFKLHRPRGIFSCGVEEPSGLVDLSDGPQPHTQPARDLGGGAGRVEGGQCQLLAQRGFRPGRHQRVPVRAATRRLLLQDIQVAELAFVRAHDSPHGGVWARVGGDGPGSLRGSVGVRGRRRRGRRHRGLECRDSGRAGWGSYDVGGLGPALGGCLRVARRCAAEPAHCRCRACRCARAHADHRVRRV